MDDVVLAGRRLLRTPGFTLAAVVTLALGIGANAALFTLVNGVLLKPVPVPLGDRLAGVVTTDDGVIGPGILPQSLFRRLLTGPTRTLQGLTWTRQFRCVWSGAGQSRVVAAEAVAGNYFQLLGISPRLGRLLVPPDDGPSPSAALVVSERMWRAQLHASPSIIGQTVRLSGLSLTVVGVVPDSFHGLMYPNLLGVDVWVPQGAATPILRPSSRAFSSSYAPGRVFVRLVPGVSFRQADAEVRVMSARSDPTDPAVGAALVSAARAVVPPQALAVGTLAGSALLVLSGLVLFVACSNLTSLWLARVHQRAGELAVRLALGADRRRVSRTLATEAAVLTAAGGFAGVWLAKWTMRVFDAKLMPELSGLVVRPDLTPDWRVFAYVTGLAIVIIGAVSAAVAAHVARIDPVRALGMSGASGGSTRRDTKTRTVLVAAQFGAAVVVILAATLFVRSFSATLAYSPGFDTAHTAIAQFDASLQGLDDARGRDVQSRILDAAVHAPGVAAGALASGVPGGREAAWMYVLAEGQQIGLMSRGVGCSVLSVSSGFFRTLGLPLRQGREFGVTDIAGARAVAIVSEGLAAALWPGQNPLGRRLRLREGRLGDQALNVVGVVADIVPSAAEPDRRRGLYVPLAQRYSPRVALLVRGGGPGVALLDPLRAATHRAAPDAALYDLRSLTDHVKLAAAGLRLVAIGLSAMGGLALLISGVGLYGLMAYLVTSRTREFGIRRALGANSWQLYGLVIKDGLRMLALGVGPGVAAAWLAAGLIRHFLVGISPRDWLTFMVVPLGLVVVGLVASFVPARRASRVDPNVALRNL